MSVVLKNTLNQAVPTLIMNPDTGKYEERRIGARAKVAIEGDLSALTESQIQNGIFKRKGGETPA